VRALKLKRGDDAFAIVKSTEVMIAKENHTLSRPRQQRKRKSARSGAKPRSARVTRPR
jgi:hypothetical protein